MISVRLLPFLLAATLLGSTPVSVPAQAARGTMSEFLAAFGSGDPARLEDFARRHFESGVVAQYTTLEGDAGRAAATTRLHDLYRLYGPVTAWSVDDAVDPPITWTRAAEVDSWIGFQPVVDPADGGWERLTVWRIRPRDAPATPVTEAAARVDSLEAWLARNAVADRFSGVVLVARGDSVVFHRGYGIADRETGEPIGLDHRFDIGSVGKMLTGVAVLRLVEEGALALDDRLSEHVPEYPAAIGDAVTVRDLLTHASGIELDDLEGFGAAIREAGTMEALLDVHLRFVSELAAGYVRDGGFDYTNEGIGLLGVIVERVSGESWESYLRRHVLEPAGMDATTFAAPDDAPVAVGYTAMDADGEYRPGPRRPAWPLIKPRAQPAGQQWSTAGDLWRFWRALTGGDLIGEASVRAMLAPQIDAGSLDRFGLHSAYGFTIQIETRDGRTHLGHGGVVPGYSAAVRHFPATGWTVIVVANLGDTAAHVAAERIEAVLMGSPAAGLAGRLDAYFAPLAAAGEFGGVVWVGDADSTRALRTYGRASHELDVPMAPDHRFRIASLTKTFTAGAVLVLRDRGALSLEDPLERWIPGFPRGERITVGHLLLHASGVGEPDLEDPLPPGFGLADLVGRIAAAPPRFEPGERSAYSNAGYSLLARVVERASGEAFDDFLRETFFEPLGMTRTGAFGPTRVVEGRADGYAPGPPPAGVAPVAPADPRAAIGSGHLWSTAEDLGRWARAVDAGSLFDVESGEWPFGWGRIRDEGRVGIDQTGLTAGYTASLAIHREADLYVVVLGNVMNTAWTTWARDASRIAFGEAVAPEPPPEPVAVAPDRLAGFAGAYEPVEEGPPPIDVALRDGHLWLQWRSARSGSWLAPVAASEFRVRGECGTVRFDGSGGMVWRCGDGETAFERIGG